MIRSLIPLVINPALLVDVISLIGAYQVIPLPCGSLIIFSMSITLDVLLYFDVRTVFKPPTQK